MCGILDVEDAKSASRSVKGHAEGMKRGRFGIKSPPPRYTGFYFERSRRPSSGLTHQAERMRESECVIRLVDCRAPSVRPRLWKATDWPPPYELPEPVGYLSSAQHLGRPRRHGQGPATKLYRGACTPTKAPGELATLLFLLLLLLTTSECNIYCR